MLERTCRCMPHVSKTGGFFVAIIRKTQKFQQDVLSGAKDPVVMGKSISNQNNTPWLSELDQESSLKIAKKSKGFQACSSNEAVCEILYEPPIRSKIVEIKLGYHLLTLPKTQQ